MICFAKKEIMCRKKDFCRNREKSFSLTNKEELGIVYTGEYCSRNRVKGELNETAQTMEKGAEGFTASCSNRGLASYSADCLDDCESDGIGGILCFRV